ncbi:hypothetical protein [Luteibacter sp. dw_328]|uniref:hypothetical protein n=1 Tax=Luteibacter sp. dw_328 TaxID=2719796 RepID=UPI001BD405EA|nr:hypothetical protein [Luteibacter sp. dw_328]
MSEAEIDIWTSAYIVWGSHKNLLRDTLMTMLPLTENTESGNRLAGRLAIVSGVFGIAAFACLIVFLVMRPSDQQASRILLRSHDAGIIVQALCLIPFTLALDAIARRYSLGSSRVMGATAVTFLTLIVILLLLSFVKVVADVLYMIPKVRLGCGSSSSVDRRPTVYRQDCGDWASWPASVSY